MADTNYKHPCDSIINKTNIGDRPPCDNIINTTDMADKSLCDNIINMASRPPYDIIINTFSKPLCNNIINTTQLANKPSCDNIINMALCHVDEFYLYIHNHRIRGDVFANKNDNKRFQ